MDTNKKMHPFLCFLVDNKAPSQTALFVSGDFLTKTGCTAVFNLKNLTISLLIAV